MTRHPKLGKLARSLRDWGKDCWCQPGTDDTCGRRFAGERDHKYTFSRIGYNLKMTDFQGALGAAQMERLPGFVAARSRNHARLNHLMRERQLMEYFILPPDHHASWFGFCLICRDSVDKPGLIKHLENAGVQTRGAFGGNILRQPGYSMIEYRISGDLACTDIVDARAFWVGCWPGLSDEQLCYTVERIAEYVDA